MANFFIVSNNPLAAEKYAAQTQLLTGSPAEVYRAARDAVHRGSRLISHARNEMCSPKAHMNSKRFARRAKALRLRASAGGMEFAFYVIC